MSATTILHLSDLHFGRAAAGSSRLELSPHELAQRISNYLLKDSGLPRPDCVVVSGDLMDTASTGEVSQVGAFLSKLTANLSLDRGDLVLVPGNHDVLWPKRSSEPDGVPTPAKPSLERFGEVFQTARPDASGRGASLFTNYWCNADVFVLGLNSCVVEGPGRNGLGYVDPKEIEAAREAYSREWDLRGIRIAVLHHHLLPVAWTAEDPERDSPSLTFNAREILALLSRLGFQIVLHGHQHQPFWARFQNYGWNTAHAEAGPETDLVVLGAGSANAAPADLGEIGRRCFNLLVVGDAACRVRGIGYRSTDFKLFADLTLPLRNQVTGAAIAAFQAHLERQSSRFAAALHSGSGGDSEAVQGKTLLLSVEEKDVLTLAPAVYAAARGHLLAAYCGTGEFWSGFLGSKMLDLMKGANPGVDTRNHHMDNGPMRRFFVAEHLSESLTAAMEKQRKDAIGVRYCATAVYRREMGPVIEELMAFCRRRFPEGPLVPLAEGVEAEVVAIAIYGSQADEGFIGFDYWAGGRPQTGLLFNLPRSLTGKVRAAMEAAWKAARSLDGTLPTPRRRALLMYGAHRWHRAPSIRYALEAGARVVLVRDTKEVEPIPESLVETVHGTDQIGLPIGSRTCDSIRKRYGPEFHCVGLDDYVSSLAAQVQLCSDSKHRTFPPQSSEVMLHKHRLRILWNELCMAPGNQWLHPTEWRLVEPGRPRPPAPDGTGPWIVKPDSLSASIEIHPARDWQEALEKATEIPRLLETKWQADAARAGVSVHTSVLIEAEIPRAAGQNMHPKAEYSIEFISLDGTHTSLGVTQKWTDRRFVEIGHLFPAATLPSDLQEAITQAVTRLLEKLEVENAISHWEFIVTPSRRVALVEGHLRPGGDHIMVLVEHATGRSPYELLFGTLLDRPHARARTARHPFDQYAGIFWLRPTAPVEGPKELEGEGAIQQPGMELVVDRRLFNASAWSGPTSWADRYLAIVGVGASPDAVMSSCRVAVEKLRLVTNRSKEPTRLSLCLDTP